MSFPWRNCLLVYSVIVTNAIALSGPIAFLPELVSKNFGLGSDESSEAIGILVGAFSFAQFFSSTALGHLSDHVGRKRLVLLGIATGAVCLAALPFCPTLGWAIADRFVEGLFNANIPLCKAILSDLTQTVPSHRALAYAYFGAAFGIARAISSSGAGLLTLVAPDTRWEYVVPCFALAAPLVVVFATTAAWLPESRKRAVVEAGPSGTEPPPPVRAVPLREGCSRLWGDARMRLLLLIYAVNSFGNGSALLMYTLALSLPVADGGLGLSAVGVGISVSAFGLAAFAFQAVFFRRLLARFGVRSVYRIGCAALTAGLAVVPLANTALLASGRPLSWITVVLCLALAAVGFMTLLPMVHTMIADASEDDTQGLSQGTAQALASLLRALGPVLSGYGVAAAVRADVLWVVFVAIAGTYTATGFLSLLLRASPREGSPEGHLAVKEPADTDVEEQFEQIELPARK